MTQEAKLYWVLPAPPQPNGLKCKLKSHTVPDQDVRVSEIIDQYMSGILTGGNDPADSQWNDEIDDPLGIDPKRLDLTEMDYLSKKIDKFAEAFEKEKEQKYKEFKEKKEKDEFEKAVKEKAEQIQSEKEQGEKH